MSYPSPSVTIPHSRNLNYSSSPLAATPDGHGHNFDDVDLVPPSPPYRNGDISRRRISTSSGSGGRFFPLMNQSQSQSPIQNQQNQNGQGLKRPTSSHSTKTMSSSNSTNGDLPPLTAPQWQHRVSASFAAMADQIAAASQAVSLIPPVNETVMNDVMAKLDAIENNQMYLKEEIERMKARIDGLTEGPEKFEKRLEEQIAAFNADQLRLPARLHNATCHQYPMLIKAPPISAGKLPKNFPATRGEFEHLTKERYEQIMTEYSVSYSGDLSAKRETLRGFLGIPTLDNVGSYKKH